MRFVHLLMGALSVMALAGWADAQALYAATASGGPGELYIINPATGATV
jgi:hypothetical protein